VRILLDHKTDVSACRGKTGATLVHVAAENASADMTLLLLSRNADVNLADKVGTTPPHVAVHECHTEIVQMLLANSPDVNAADYDGDTAVHLAVA